MGLSRSLGAGGQGALRDWQPVLRGVRRGQSLIPFPSGCTPTTCFLLRNCNMWRSLSALGNRCGQALLRTTSSAYHGSQHVHVILKPQGMWLRPPATSLHKAVSAPLGLRRALLLDQGGHS